MRFLDTAYVDAFAEEHRFPREARTCFVDLTRRLLDNPENAGAFEAVCSGYMFPEAHDPKIALENLKPIAEKSGTHEYTINMLFWILCGKELRERYAAQRIDSHIFFDTMEDLRCKLNECIECKGICGSFVNDWFHGFYCLNRFALGRFQYGKDNLWADYRMPDRTVIPAGTRCMNFHIPSSGVPLTDGVRFDSYRRAYRFFRDYFDSDLMVLTCSSWLLYDKHREFLPKSSNILKFMDDFDIVAYKEKEGFGDGWRVFGKYANLPYDRLPEDTSLRKAYKEWLMKTGKSGGGTGVIVFDGEKIVNKR
jgi:hypothetical protein